MKKKHVIRMIGLAMAITVALAGCGGNKETGAGDNQKVESSGTEDTAQEESSGEEVKIPVIVTTGTNDGMDLQMQEAFDGFNEAYKGKYQLDVEYMAGSADDYRSKLKMLNTSDSMPALIDIGTEPAFFDLLVENGRLADIAPYLENDEEWRSWLMPQGIEELTREDGTMYMVPPTGLQMVGIYYNKELFEQAGIEKFPETWDEFWTACEKLTAEGITPLSLMTAETAWCPMLGMTAYLGGSQNGRDFMSVRYPDNFDTSEFKEAVEILKKEFEYTTADAVGGTYALAANHFFSGDTAMIANGPWMMPSLSDPDYAPAGFEQKVGYAPFPGNLMIGSIAGWSVTSCHDQAVVDGAVEFMKFYSSPKYATQRALKSGQLSSVIEFPQEEYDKLIPAMKDCVDISKEVEIVLPSYQSQWDPVNQNDVFGREIPNLVTGSITTEDFIEMLNKGAAQYKKDIE